MAIKDTNSRIIVTIPTKLKDFLEEESKKELRTVSKQLELILRERYNFKE